MLLVPQRCLYLNLGLVAEPGDLDLEDRLLLVGSGRCAGAFRLSIAAPRAERGDLVQSQLVLIFVSNLFSRRQERHDRRNKQEVTGGQSRRVSLAGSGSDAGAQGDSSQQVASVSASKRREERGSRTSNRKKRGWEFQAGGENRALFGQPVAGRRRARSSVPWHLTFPTSTQQQQR